MPWIFTLLSPIIAFHYLYPFVSHWNCYRLLVWHHCNDPPSNSSAIPRQPMLRHPFSNSMHPPNRQNQIVTFWVANENLEDLKSTPDPAQYICKRLGVTNPLERLRKVILTYNICIAIINILLYKIWRPVDQFLLVVETPNLPPLILLLSHYNPPTLRLQIRPNGYWWCNWLTLWRIRHIKMISPTR